MSEFEKQLKEMLQENSTTIPVALFFVGLALELCNVFKEAFKNIEKGIKEND